MKYILITLAAVVLLFAGIIGADAAQPNLLTNGSFEDGLRGWQVAGPVQSVTGVCGAKAANLEGGFLRNQFKLTAGRTYKLTFRFVGTLELSAGEGRFKSTQWTKFTRRFKAENTGDTVWFMGFENLPVQIDCVKLVRVKTK